MVVGIWGLVAAAYCTTNCFDLIPCGSGNFTEECVPIPGSATANTPQGARDTLTGYQPFEGLECGWLYEDGVSQGQGCGGPPVATVCGTST